MFHLPPTSGWIASGIAPVVRFFPSIPIAIRNAVAVFLLASVTSSPANTIHWGSEAFAVHSDSKGITWTMDYSLTLGVFRAGFIPSPANRESWLENFHPISSATFDPEEKRYAGTADLSQSLPSGFSDTAHIWAKNRDEITTGPEWLLLTSPSWKWVSTPTAGLLALPETWITSQSTNWILGSPTSTIPVRPTVIAPQTWLAKHFPTNPDEADPLADPDQDGIPNATEYLLGTDPTKSNSANHDTSVSGNEVTFHLTRNPYAESDFILETSSDLTTWKAVTRPPSADRPDLIEYTLPVDSTSGPKFFRFNLSANTSAK